MARWTRNHVLEISAVTLAVGLVLAILSYAYAFADAPSWLNFYDGILQRVPGTEAVGANLWILIISTIMVLSGGFYFGEQIVLRRRFERLISTPKKSEFVSNRKKLEALVPRLPTQYRGRVREREEFFRSMR